MVMAPPMPAQLNRVGIQMQETNGIRMSPYMDVSQRLNDHDKDYMLYAPQSLQEQQQIAAQWLPSVLATPRQYLHKTGQVVALMEAVKQGSQRAKVQFMEALSVDDFNYIMQDIIYRKMMDKWAVPDSPYDAWSKEVKVPTIDRPGKMFALDGLETPIPLVYPGEQPTVRSPYDAGIAITCYKYMADVEILFETMIEDDLNALGDIPDRLTNAIKATKGRINTGTYAKGSGFKDNQVGEPFYVSNNDKIKNPALSSADPAGIANKLTSWNVAGQFGVASNAPISLPAIQAARTQISKFLSPDGNPIDVKLVHLVTGVGNAEVARNVLGAQSYQMERAGGLPADSGNNAGFVRMTVSRDSISGIQHHVDPYLHTIVTGSKADTMWMLVADKNIARPMFAHCVLAGYEQPIVARRIPQYRGVGQSNGRGVEWISMGFRVGFIYGTQWGDARGAMASDGQ